MSGRIVRIYVVIGLVVFSGLYFVTHLIGLVSLPVFADESIYIRWAQLILTDPSRYMFFPLNDGKTPLFIWQLVPLLSLNYDPLWISRVLSVLAGFIQLILFFLIGKKMQLRWTASIVGILIVVFAPYWFFHHRMALMDAWLVVWLSACVLGVITLTSISKSLIDNQKLSFFNEARLLLKNLPYLAWILFIVISFAAALLTKIPAILALPALAISPWLQVKSRRQAIFASLRTICVLVVGLILGSLILLNPSGPQLLNRSSDFLLPIGEVLRGRWIETVPSLGTYLSYFSSYLGIGVILMSFAPFFSPKWRRIGIILYLQWFFFIAPIWILGRVVFPRYLFPGALWLTLAAMVGAEVLIEAAFQKRTPLKRLVATGLMVLFIGMSVLTAWPFLNAAWFHPNELPLLAPDQAQYLASWSSGHGVTETMALMQHWSATHPSGELLVATEGRFGTLPDGLLLYNFAHPIARVRIEGTGLTGLDRIPSDILALAPSDATKWLVVNSNRLINPLPTDWLVAEYCRPVGGICLQVWELKSDVY